MHGAYHGYETSVAVWDDINVCGDCSNRLLWNGQYRSSGRTVGRSFSTIWIVLCWCVVVQLGGTL